MNFSKLLDKIELKQIYQRSFHLKFIKIGAFVLYIYIYAWLNSRWPSSRIILSSSFSNFRKKKVFQFYES